MNTPLIAPSILASDFTQLGKEIKAVEEAGADWIHIDVMDGHFVPNLTMGPDIVKAVKRCTELPLDVHLMVSDPDANIELFANTGADMLTIHAEATPHIQRSLQNIKSKGLRAGLSLTPSTPLSFLDHVMDDLDLILLMTVNPGFGGQSYIPAMTQKISQTAQRIKSVQHSITLQVDGGVTPKNSQRIVQAGANCLVAGSAIFKSDNYKEAIVKLKQS